MTQTFRVRKILFATDFSECSEAALEAAAGIAATMQAPVTVLHVAYLPDASHPSEIWAYDHAEVVKTIVRDAKAELERYVAERFPAAVVTERRVAAGIPDVEIVEVAKAGGHDLIVMGTHGRSGLTHLLVGSVAERVLRSAPCPVLTVPASVGALQARAA